MLYILCLYQRNYFPRKGENAYECVKICLQDWTKFVNCANMRKEDRCEKVHKHNVGRGAVPVHGHGGICRPRSN